MSFNNNHITPVLTLANYEEYFLLYVDNELTPEAKKAVEAFVQLHPHLKEELNLLCSTILPADDFSFAHKEELFAASMKLDAIDELLLLYIDNELPAAETGKIKARLKSDTVFALQHALLLKTKMDKAEQISYPYKSGLYRNTERRTAPYWLRVAAAIVLVAGAGTAAWLRMNPATTTNPGVAVVIPKKDVPQPTPGLQLKAPVTILNSETAVVPGKNNAVKEKKQATENMVAVVKRAANKKENPTFSKPHTAVANALASNNVLLHKEAGAVAGQPDMAKKIAKPAVNNSVVTSEIPPAYIPLDAAAKTLVPVQAVATTNNADNGRSGGVKGFLRKATRFIERRTGIKTVNDDDELLVGAVALKL